MDKIKKKAEAEAKQAALDAIRKIPPSEMFKSETDKYSKFDDKVRKNIEQLKPSQAHTNQKLVSHGSKICQKILPKNLDTNFSKN